jgi:hypothetical protein
LAVDFVKGGRAGVRQRGISSGIEQWAGMLQAHPARCSWRLTGLALDET